MMQAPVLVPIPLVKLSKKHREFIKSFVRSGNDLQAYLESYKETAGAKSKARKLRSRLAVYIDQELQEYIKGTDLAIMAVQVVGDLARNSASDATRLQAAKDILSRGGHDVEKEVTIKHETKDMSNAAIDKRLAELKEELWNDVPTLKVVQPTLEVLREQS
jgi:hypothetical protein